MSNAIIKVRYNLVLPYNHFAAGYTMLSLLHYLSMNPPRKIEKRSSDKISLLGCAFRICSRRGKRVSLAVLPIRCPPPLRISMLSPPLEVVHFWFHSSRQDEIGTTSTLIVPTLPHISNNWNTASLRLSKAKMFPPLALTTLIIRISRLPTSSTAICNAVSNRVCPSWNWYFMLFRVKLMADGRTCTKFWEFWAGAVPASKIVVEEKTGRIKRLAPLQVFHWDEQKSLHWWKFNQFSIPVTPKSVLPYFFFLLIITTSERT